LVLRSRDLARGSAARLALAVAAYARSPWTVDSIGSVNAAARPVGHDFGRWDVPINNAAITNDTDARAIRADLSVCIGHSR
jgi:NAD(P)-dependent dehydrogenase (short-subunit alcohol dehydrogenase family)